MKTKPFNEEAKTLEFIGDKFTNNLSNSQTCPFDDVTVNVIITSAPPISA